MRASAGTFWRFWRFWGSPAPRTRTAPACAAPDASPSPAARPASAGPAAARPAAGSLPALLLAALLAAGAALAPAEALAADISEVFLALPPEDARGLSSTLRRDLLDRAHQGASGYSAPSPEGFWLELHNDRALTLYGSGSGPVVYKIFPMRGDWALVAVCRSRQTQGPSSLAEPPHDSPLDLTLRLLSPSGEFRRAEIADYLPPISVLDFTTADTMLDRRAASDLAVIDQFFGDCLTCHASAGDPLALDVLTVTSINGHSCAHHLARFKLLPLKWEGDRFTKPYDRAAPRQDVRRPDPPPRGLYYHEDGP